MSVYKVVSTIWHSKDNKYYEPGETVDLSHLDGFALDALLASGAVQAVEEKKKKPVSPAESKEGE